ncbi:two component transcriptional regulator, LuxR family [Dyadobacter soli]|uniref:Two component transcriptional regulator, LuxR family n=1 Tax=Dyadobacter soli TaxID=659014 RepID=A0A1G7Y098_9BACT|nr:response regulator transcription factor [Dyadobacter soli]SDG89706.1 two component transcriptional regulator, LuxR family [Dyadobacter soli]
MISVSIVEDHDAYRFSLVKMLKSNPDFGIAGVYDSAEKALALMPGQRPDIAIVDIELKGMSGIDLIRSVRDEMPNTQFLICTSYQDNQNVFNALRAGALGYILKDATSREIQNAIIELNNGGSPMSPYIARQVIMLMGSLPTQEYEELSIRELEVITLLSKGLLYKEISDTLSISHNTVKNHLKNIYKKMHVQNKVEAVNKYNSRR